MKKSKHSCDDRKLTDRLTPDATCGRLLGILATTYEMQREFVETDFLPSMLGLGAWDDRKWASRIALEKNLSELEAATILLDARPYRGRPRSLHIEVVPVPLEAGRILHAKVLIGVYEEAVKLFVGSANLTEPGYRKNREVVSVLTASEKKPAAALLIVDAINGMKSLMNQWLSPGAIQLQDIALKRLIGWSEKSNAAGQWFVWGGGEQALWQQYLDRWPATDGVKKITIVSPFWSEEQERGPIKTFVTALQQRGNLTADAELYLLTEAAPDRETTFKPKLPETYSNFDSRTVGINAWAMAVDPRVPPEEIGMSEEFIGIRNLHAKIVLLEGAENSLLFIGSANFTRHGWGFLPNPRQANIEAGLIVRRAGVAKNALRNLIPKTTGDAVPLCGAAAGKLALPDPLSEELPWPAFLREVLLAPSENNAEVLELVVNVEDSTDGAWSISHMPADDSPQEALLTVNKPGAGLHTYRLVLSEGAVRRLMIEQEVFVKWWKCPEGRSFPINVTATARLNLPASPGTGRPGEQTLIDYYQGRIEWEDIYPDPDAEGGATGTKQSNSDQKPERGEGVDTSRIQSYIVREFVEALKGMRDNLKEVSQAPKVCMRQALLGSVSPVALAKLVVEAVDAKKRTPTAAGFQLVEILACLDEARHHDAAAAWRTDWFSYIDEASSIIVALLDEHRRRHAEELPGYFQRYAGSLRHYYQAGANKA